MEDKTRLEEKRLQFENSIIQHIDFITRLTAGSVRGMVTIDETLICKLFRNAFANDESISRWFR